MRFHPSVFRGPFGKATQMLILLFVLALCACGCRGSLPTGHGQSASGAVSQPTQAEQPSPIRLLLWRNSAVAARQGVYFLGYDSPNVIYYYDEASGLSVPLCSQPNCAHNSDACTAYAAGMLYLMLDEENESQPLYLYRTVDSLDPNEYPKAQIYSMDANGANRTLRLEYQNGLITSAMAASDEHLYFLASEVDETTQESVVALYQAPLNGSGPKRLAQYTSSTVLLGAYDQKLILEHNNGSFAGAVADVVEYDVATGQEKQLFHYEADPQMDEHFNRKANPVAFSYQHQLYVLEPNGEKQAQLSCWDLRTGAQQVIAQSVPYYAIHAAEDGRFFDGKLMLSCTENLPDGAGPTGKTFAIDLQTGEYQTIDLTTEIGSPFEIYGETQSHYIILSGGSLRTSTMLKEDGTTEELSYSDADFYLMDKADYYASIDEKELLR